MWQTMSVGNSRMKETGLLFTFILCCPTPTIPELRWCSLVNNFSDPCSDWSTLGCFSTTTTTSLSATLLTLVSVSYLYFLNYLRPNIWLSYVVSWMWWGWIAGIGWVEFCHVSLCCVSSFWEVIVGRCSVHPKPLHTGAGKMSAVQWKKAWRIPKGHSPWSCCLAARQWRGVPQIIQRVVNLLMQTVLFDLMLRGSEKGTLCLSFECL